MKRGDRTEALLIAGLVLCTFGQAALTIWMLLNSLR